MTKAYYNEHDPRMAAVLRELIRQNLITPGDVDERSIVDVLPTDLLGYTQCHFFAGIGVWSYALRLAGVPDDARVWTGSCPCQPFSAAGAGAGFADERHLWPHWHHLIAQCQPPIVFGEQVASKDGLGWLDLVFSDLEGSGYACGASDLCAAGFGAPHIRQRLFFGAGRLADAYNAGPQGWWQPECERPGQRPVGARGVDGWLEHPEGDGRDERRAGPDGGRAACGCSPDGLADAHVRRREQESNLRPPGLCREDVLSSGVGIELGCLRAAPSGLADAHGDGCGQGWGGLATFGGDGAFRDDGLSTGQPHPRPVDGFWRNADWLYGRDGKWRAVEPGAFPLADRAAARVGRLHGYGNAIVAPVASAFIESWIAAWNAENTTQIERMMG